MTRGWLLFFACITATTDVLLIFIHLALIAVLVNR